MIGNPTFRTLGLQAERILASRDAQGMKTPEPFRALVAELNDVYPDPYLISDIADVVRQNTGFYLEPDDPLLILLRDSLKAIGQVMNASKGAFH